MYTDKNKGKLKFVFCMMCQIKEKKDNTCVCGC